MTEEVHILRLENRELRARNDQMLATVARIQDQNGKMVADWTALVARAEAAERKVLELKTRLNKMYGKMGE